MTYSFKSPKSDDKCDECGRQATIVLVADSGESDTGYVDEVLLCEECAERARTLGEYKDYK